MNEYIILQSSGSHHELQVDVARHLNSGYKCQGGVSVCYDSHMQRTYYYQAMIKTK